MKLRKLLHNIPSAVIKGNKDIDISALCNDSRQASPGCLFFAKRGSVKNGATYIPEALESGAIAIATDLFNPFITKAIQIIHPNVPLLESLLSEKFYFSPSSKLLTVGVTGTNGKTTTTYLIKHLLDHLLFPTGLIGTIEYIVGKNIFPSTYTTPDILTNQKLLHEMHLSGCKAAVMEVSSHGLDQGRVQSIQFDIGVYTNLTPEHLDYHKDMTSYAAAKAKLFQSLNPMQRKEGRYPKVAIFNADCPWFPYFEQQTQAPILTYGIDRAASLQAHHIISSLSGSTCTISYLGQSYPFHTPLLGSFNLQNCLAAAAVGVSLGYPPAQVLSILSSFSAIPGRMERVVTPSQKQIFVDFAHTEDALRRSLLALRPLVSGQLFCLFGCGGDRDKEKRPKMGQVADSLADQVILTSDNPRGEPPDQVIAEILSGISHPHKVWIEVDRKKAIAFAIQRMQAQDTLLIAGKGHEHSQIFAHHTIRFDDRIIAKECCL